MTGERSAASAGLAVSRLSTGYGRMQVVREISVDVAPGELVALVGRNGAGKSTALAAIAGLRHGPTTGSIRLGDRDIARLRPAAIYAAGLALVPEGHRLFPTLSVLDNLRLGGFPWRRAPEGGPRLAAQEALVFELFPALEAAAARLGGDLSGGQQQMLAIGQALMGRPAVLLLDEPSSGLAPSVVDAIYQALFTLRDQGCGLLVVEQNLDRALTASSRTYVLERGEVVLAGPSAGLATDDRVAATVRGTGNVDNQAG